MKSEKEIREEIEKIEKILSKRQPAISSRTFSRIESRYMTLKWVLEDE